MFVWRCYWGFSITVTNIIMLIEIIQTETTGLLFARTKPARKPPRACSLRSHVEPRFSSGLRCKKQKRSPEIGYVTRIILFANRNGGIIRTRKPCALGSHAFAIAQVEPRFSSHLRCKNQKRLPEEGSLF